MLRMFALLVAGAVALPASPAPSIGAPAPGFRLPDSNGVTHALSDYRGKTVVLEWNNPDCPFVRKHYRSGNIPRQQADATAQGVVWLTINSGASGKQGHVDGNEANEFLAQYQANPSAYLLDTDGKVGKAYAAKTTPQLFVIDAGGTLRYMGAIDSIASTDVDDLSRATQYVPQALAELKSGKAVSVPVSKPYGCGIKYGS